MPLDIDLLLETLKDRGHQGGARIRTLGIRYGLIVAQISLTFMLLTSALLLINTFKRLLDINLGFNPERVLTVDVSVPAKPSAAAAVPPVMAICEMEP